MEHYKEFAEKVPVLGFIIKWLSGNNMDYGGLMMFLGLFILGYIFFYTDISAWQIFIITAALSPFWATYLLFDLFYNKWMDMVGKGFALYNRRTTLRIKLPPEVFKSPEAMEFALAQIHNTANPDNLMQTYLQGKRPLNYGLEIVSIGGDVRFYINVPTSKTKPAVEVNLYAQYPGVEITEEAVDYAAEFPIGGGDTHELFSCHMRKKKGGDYPIKTYLEFGLDKMPKEEEKVDPITPMLEVLSSIKPDERLYIQYIIKPFRTDSFKGGQLVKKEGPDWSVGVKAVIDKMMKRDEKGNPIFKKEGETEREELSRLTAGERDTVAALERYMSKYAYWTGIRWLYIYPKGKFDSDLPNRVIRSFSQWDVLGRNAIGVAWRTDTHYKDIIPGDYKKIDGWKKQEHSEYKRRLFYTKDSPSYMKIFNVEELASLWHLPGKVAITPSLGRIDAKRSEAPNNLPTG